MWEKLIQLKHFFCGDVWCVVGDFNSVLHTFERLRISATNRSGENIEIREFGDFDSLMGLIDLPLLGRRFTWFKPNGNAASRLDRFLVSDGWWERWGVTSEWALPIDVSYLCPIVLRYSSQLWGPKPFRFNNFWIEHRGLSVVIEQSWQQQVNQTWMAPMLTEKFTILKADLKVWNK
jgi:hypothetical protein